MGHHVGTQLDMGGDGPQHVWHWETVPGCQILAQPLPNRSDECNLFYNLPEQTLPEVVCNLK